MTKQQTVMVSMLQALRGQIHCSLLLELLGSCCLESLILLQNLVIILPRFSLGVSQFHFACHGWLQVDFNQAKV